MVKKILEAEFKDSVKSGYSVVDFSATWCGPCQALAPVLENVAESMKDKAQFFAVDVDEAESLCRKLGIMSVPAVILFKDGNVVSQSVGFKPKEALESWISENL